MNHIAQTIDRMVTMRTGAVALSPCRIWIKPQTRNNTPKIHKSRTIRQLLHGYWPPPHCRARRRQTIDGTRNMVPQKSNFWSTERKLGVWFAAGFGGKWTTNRTTKKVTPPRGRLIQKHHPRISKYRLIENEWHFHTPCGIICEDSSQKGSNGLCNTNGSANCTCELGSLVEGRTVCDDLDWGIRY